MRGNTIALRIFWMLSLFIFLTGITEVRSQDVFRELDDIKKEIASLKNEINDLRNQFFGLRQAILRSVASQDQEASLRTAPEKSTDKKLPVDETELTNSICQAVGKFFGDVDAALRMRDSTTADDRMRIAFRNLNSTLQDYSKLHRVSKLLGIYEGLAWDTYVAVELMGSVQGNEEFIKTINRHKQKYNDTCLKK